MIKVSIPIIRDSWNSYPQDELEFIINKETVTIKLRDNSEDRIISVNREDFSLISEFLANMPVNESLQRTAYSRSKRSLVRL